MKNKEDFTNVAANSTTMKTSTTVDETVVVASSRAAQARANVLARMGNLSRSQIMFGVPEIVGLAAAMLLLVVTALAYFYTLAPAREHLQTLEAKRASQQKLLRESDQGLQQGASRQVTVAEITNSLRSFQENYLPLQTQGRTEVIIALNDATRRNNLRNAGFSFTPLEALPIDDPAALPRGGRRAASSTNAKLQSVFPGTGITLSVEGQYQSLRRFMRDIEAGNKQFIIIDGVELEGMRDADASGAARGALVNLRLNMSAYFRPDALPAAASANGTDTDSATSATETTVSSAR